MAPYNDTQQAFVLPDLKHIFKTGTETDRFILYDVKFYPYSDRSITDPIFGIVAQKKIYIGRLSAENDAIVTMLHEVEDEQECRDTDSSGLNSCSWCYINPSQPLLAVAGGSGQLKVIDAVEGRRFTTFVGHGHGTINDIATHPLYPWILATASMDKSIRIWDLRRHSFRHESPTIIICGQATGHSEGILTVSWHSNGRYLITGGHDHRVCVWTIQDLADASSFWQEIAPGNRKRSSHEVKIIHFPHFTTSAVHGEFVDCARFFGDIVISKAAKENKIVVWRITGFDTRKRPPDPTTAPKIETYLDTRNGFMRTATRNKQGIDTVKLAPELQDQPPYHRLLEFDSPNSTTFYLRFALLLPSLKYPELHPVVAFGSEASQIRFWDLERLSMGHAGGLDKNKPPVAKNKKKDLTGRTNQTNIVPQLAADERASPNLVRESTASSISNMSSGPWPHRQSSTEATSVVSEDLIPNGSDPPFQVPDRKRNPIHDPHKRIKAHETITLTKLQYKNKTMFLTRTTDWSPCGRWCIAVGESTLESGEGWGGFAVLYR